MLLESVEPAILPWAVTLIGDALQSCPRILGLSVLTLSILMIGMGSLLGYRGRSWWAFGSLLVLFLAAAWLLRDRLLLLGDSRLWIHTAQAFGTEVPLYRAPVAAWIIGLVGSVGGAAQTSLAILSIGAGAATAGVLYATHRSLGAGLLLALVFGQTLSFIFFGHIETYALLALALVAFLESLRQDFPLRRPSPLTVFLFLLVIGMHFVGLLMVIPMAVFLGPRLGLAERTRFWILIVFLAATVFLVPGLRSTSILGMNWQPHELLVYLMDVLNGWTLLLIPTGFWFLVLGRPKLDDPYARCLAYALILMLILPFFRVFEIGVYRDLDLFAPAFTLCIMLTIHMLENNGPLPRFRLAIPLSAGVILLAPWITLTLCSGGMKTFESQLAHAAMTPSARSYGYEVLAYSLKDEARPEDGEAMMRRAIEVTPGNLRLWGPMGEMQLARGDTAAAILSLEKAMQSPRAPRTAPLLGEILTGLGRPLEAIQLLEPRREELLGNSKAAAALAVAYFRVGLPESTIAVGRAQLTMAPNDDVAHFNVASGLAQLGDLEGSVRSLASAIDLAPERIAYHRALIQVLLQYPDGRSRAEAYLDALEPGLREDVMGRRPN